MAADTAEDALLASAISGDRDATGQILWIHYDRLLQYIASRIPAALRRSVDPEDLLSQTFVEVWRHIRQFQPHGPDAFGGWLRTISDRKLLDEIKSHKRAKRGGGQPPVERLPGESSSFVSLLDLIAGAGSTPSRQASRREAERALRLALASLQEDHQQVIRLRYLQALSVADVAARMERSEPAVVMLCRRALKNLREALGSGFESAS